MRISTGKSFLVGIILVIATIAAAKVDQVSFADTAPDWLWAKSAGGKGGDWGASIAVDGSGDAYVAGSFSSPTLTIGSTILANASPPTLDLFVVKYDSLGNVLWAKSASGTGYDEGFSIAVDGSGDAYVTGNSTSPTITFGSATLSNAGSFVAKYDSNGNVLWARSAGGTEPWV